MRPEILNPLFRPVTGLKGVGPRTATLVERVAGPMLVDLVWHLPTGRIDRRLAPSIRAAPEDMTCTLKVTVVQHQKPRTRRLPYRVVCADDSDSIDLVFFNAKEDYLLKVLPDGETRLVSGRVQSFRDRLQMTHPDYILAEHELADLPPHEPVYPLTEGLTPRLLRRAVDQAVAAAPELPEWQDAAWLEKNKWASWLEALKTAHRPETDAELLPEATARARLAYDELLANQLALALIRQHMRKRGGRSLIGDGRLRDRLREKLPFKLTAGQDEAIGEILDDMAAPARMLRLLQGDVGSGKTVVALFAMLAAVEAGAQAALMAPTEILARQHFANLAPLCAAAGIKVDLVLGAQRGSARAAARDGLASGRTDIAIGTHALLQADLAFRDLGLAVVDEQHRFGVHQRLNLSGKGDAVDVLVMTATPIPRTLALTAYGDMDVSILREKQPGRAPVDTRVVPLSRLDEVVGAIGRRLDDGDRVYWVCPLVEESETQDLSAAEERHATLARLFGAERVGLLHGRLSSQAKDDAMTAFAEGKTRLLVATTVIEVGVDVPEATVMVIEHAERFGLAQLHQLRGRIGRGGHAGTCLLLRGEDLTETARARLEVLRRTEDGFEIAETDLDLRGTGELLGTRQSGLPAFRVADLAAHREFLAVAADDARLVLHQDEKLNGPRGQALRVLLYLFQRDAAVRYLESG